MKARTRRETEKKDVCKEEGREGEKGEKQRGKVISEDEDTGEEKR